MGAMGDSGSLQLKTLGHATLVVTEGGVPLIATDPWLIGSVYWRSWWLEKYPTDEEMGLVADARHIYVTHSHPDHFHWPTLRKLQPKSTLHPTFPRYAIPSFLKENGVQARTLEPWAWYQITDNVRVASVPIPVDDSVLIIDTPTATIANLNDSNPRLPLLKLIRDRLCEDGKPVVMLKSYSPASAAVSLHTKGQPTPAKSKEDYVQTVRRLGRALGASHFIPFASQAFFYRSDSHWANKHKVVYEDLLRYWGHDDGLVLCKPFVTMDLQTLDYQSDYSQVNRSLDQERLAKVTSREQEEAAFALPEDFDARLTEYLKGLYFLRILFRRGIGWRLSTSGEERFFNSRRGVLEKTIPDNYDVIFTLPDKVLYESLQNNILTDLGITMFLRLDSKVSVPMTYLLFLLMGLHDYGHFDSPKDFARLVRFYVPYLFPSLFRIRSSVPSVKSLRSAEVLA